ncbi:MAG: hypothetical protein IJP98_06695 [Clostridia bacterium]|nr:hypothetical protein [Clostridia bacterium]
MKKRIFILFFAVLLLFGCQPTPETEIVVGKDQDIMIGKAEEEATYETADPEKLTVDWYERLGAPTHYTASLVSGGGHLKTEVDAPIVLPDTELPIVRIAPVLFSDEDAHRFVTALLGENPQCVDPWGENNRTRASYEKEVLTYKDALEHWNEYGNLVYGENFETKENFERYLQKLMAQAANAPEKPETFAPTYEWETPHVWTPGGEKRTNDRYLTFLTVNADDSQSRLDIFSSSEFGNSSVYYQRDIVDDVHYPIDGTKWQNGLDISEADARAEAECVLATMGLEHLECAFTKSVRVYPGDVRLDAVPYRAYWAFVYTMAVNGAQTTFTQQSGVEPNDYARNWEYERCYVLVDDDGVAGLFYNNPCVAQEVTVSAATLLSYEKILDIFEKMVVIVDNNADPMDRDEQYCITSVRLGLVSIREQNGEGGLLVPAWDFLGYRVDENLASFASDERYSFLTINAVDGSIIKRDSWVG